jgi:hypothetical protein
MRTTRNITASLAAVVAAAALAGPAGAVPADSGKANVYVPPASIAAPAKANVYVPPASLAAGDPAKADVYVPPASLASGTAAVAAVAAKPQPHQGAPASASSSSFDWGSAGEGAAAGIAALLVAFGAAMGLRRRGQAGPAISA